MVYASSPTHVASKTHPFKADEPATPNIYPNQLSNDSFSDASSIMVYSPLFPTQSDLVELAEHVPYDTDSAEVQERHVVENSAEGGDNARTQEVPTGRPSWTSIWPFSKWYRKDQQAPPSSLGTAVSLSGIHNAACSRNKQCWFQFTKNTRLGPFILKTLSPNFLVGLSSVSYPSLSPRYLALNNYPHPDIFPHLSL
jgi:hypothetical protein